MQSDKSQGEFSARAKSPIVFGQSPLNYLPLLARSPERTAAPAAARRPNFLAFETFTTFVHIAKS